MKGPKRLEGGTITYVPPQEFIVQISRHNGTTGALSNYGNIYTYRGRLDGWFKLPDIPFEELNKEKDEEETKVT